MTPHDSIFAAITSFVRDALTANLGLKALSLAFALGLFSFLHGQQDQQQRTIPVGVVVRLPPENVKRELMTQIPASIHVTLRGPTRAIDRLVQTGVTPVELDLRDGNEDQITFNPERLALPPDLRATIIDPPRIDLEWQNIVQRRVPVQASITGTPAEGYVVKGEPDVDPSYIEVRGPESLVEVMQFARLDPFDVSGLTEGVYRRRIAIDAPPARVTYLGAQSASVGVTIARRVIEVKFTKRPVEVVGLKGARPAPDSVDVTVTGPPEVVRALRAEQIRPIADLTKLEGIDLDPQRHGTASVPVQVELANASADIQPPAVTVRW